MYPKSGDEGQLNQKLNFQYVNFRKLSVVKNDPPPHTHKSLPMPCGCSWLYDNNVMN